MKHAKTLAGLASALVALTALPAHVQAQQMAYVSKEVNLRAGPSSDFPVVAILGAGVNITVEGCMSDYRWCDVSVGPNRGWLYAGNIVYPYQGANVPLLTYGSAIGIGVIAFSVGSYWDDYYRFRPWYPQRQHWIDRPYAVPYPVPYSVPYPVLRPGFQHPPGVNPGFRPHHRPHHRPYDRPYDRPYGGPDVGHRPPPQVVVPVPHPPLGPRPGFDQHPPPGVRPIQGPVQRPVTQGPVIQGQPAMPRPHQGMRRNEGQRSGEAHGHGTGRQP